MYFDLEEKFVNDFINPSYRDRLLFELKTSKKRLNALMRFSHNMNDLLIKDMIYSKLKKFEYNQLNDFLNGQNFYVISFKYLNGIIMNVNEVLDYISDECMPVIVCGNNNAIIKKDKVIEARVLVVILSLSLGYLLTNFVVAFVN